MVLSVKTVIFIRMLQHCHHVTRIFRAITTTNTEVRQSLCRTMKKCSRSRARLCSPTCRRPLPGGSSTLQPVGATAKEAFHVELRVVFRHVYCMHAPVLRIQSRSFVLCKQVAFEGELETAGLSPVRQRKAAPAAVRCKTEALKRTVVTRKRRVHLIWARSQWR